MKEEEKTNILIINAESSCDHILDSQQLRRKMVER